MNRLMLGYDSVPFVLPPLMAMDSAMRPTSGITFDGALPTPERRSVLDADITFDDEPENPGIPMSQAFKHFDRIKR